MRLSSFALAAASAAVVTLAGCASQPTVSSSSTASSAAPAASTSMPSMQIPPASGKRVVLNMQLDAKHPKDSGWDGFKKEWHDITKEQASAQGVAFAAQEGDAKPTGEAGTLVVVKINDYKHVSIGARIMLGIMTGNAFIDAKVEFRDLATGKLYGERSYNTSSSAWQGVFAAVTPKQIYTLADQLLMEMKRS